MFEDGDVMFEAGNLIGFNNMNPIIILNFPPVLFRWWIVVGSINYFGPIFDIDKPESEFPIKS